MNVETSAIVKNTRALAARKRAKGETALADSLDRAADRFAVKVATLCPNGGPDHVAGNVGRKTCVECDGEIVR